MEILAVASPTWASRRASHAAAAAACWATRALGWGSPVVVGAEVAGSASRPAAAWADSSRAPSPTTCASRARPNGSLGGSPSFYPPPAARADLWIGTARAPRRPPGNAAERACPPASGCPKGTSPRLLGSNQLEWLQEWGDWPLIYTHIYIYVYVSARNYICHYIVK